MKKEPLLTENKHSRLGTAFYRGNIAVMAASNAVRSFGGGLASTYISSYFSGKDGIGGDPITLGLITSIASIIQVLLLFLGGFIADHYGRRRILVITAFYGMITPLIYVLVQDWRIFAAATIASAIGIVSSPASHAIVADSISPEKRTTGIAWLQVVSSLPMIAAPAAGGWLISIYGLIEGFKLASLFTAATALVSALIYFLFLKETMRGNGGQRTKLLGSGTLKDFTKRLTQTSNSLRVLLVSYALIVFANALVSQYYILYAEEIIGITRLDWGIIVSLQFLLANILKIPGGWISDRFGKRKVMVISVLACAPCAILFTLSQSFFQTAIAALLLVATGIYYAQAHEALQADFTPRETRGRITALWDIGTAISTAFGAPIGGFLFQAVNPAMPFYLFAAVEVVAAFLIVAAVREPTMKEI